MLVENALATYYTVDKALRVAKATSYSLLGTRYWSAFFRLHKRPGYAAGREPYRAHRPPTYHICRVMDFKVDAAATDHAAQRQRRHPDQLGSRTLSKAAMTTYEERQRAIGGERGHSMSAWVAVARSVGTSEPKCRAVSPNECF